MLSFGYFAHLSETKIQGIRIFYSFSQNDNAKNSSEHIVTRLALFMHIDFLFAFALSKNQKFIIEGCYPLRTLRLCVKLKFRDHEKIKLFKAYVFRYMAVEFIIHYSGYSC